MADLPLRELTLSGWGNSLETTTLAARPERLSEVRELMTDAGPLLAHGMGRSYGDAPLAPNGGKTVLMTRLNRLVSFDKDTAELVAEGGVTFNEILELFGPRGWMLPVTPGTAFVTLGGAIANDVHGKNHLTAGSIGRHVRWIDLLLATGEVRRISREEHAPLFFATLGGIGLTGIILRAAIKLEAILGGLMQVTRQRTKDLDDTLAVLNTHSPDDPHDIMWLDVLERGGGLGRGIYERAHYIKGEWRKAGRGLSMPVNLPGFILNPASIGIFNKLRYNIVGPQMAKQMVLPVRKFMYPLDNILNWNRMYGKRGFRQFQVVLPTDEAPKGMRKLLEAISSSRQGSFLATLKKLGAEGEGYLSFPKPGFTLALDFPNNPGLGELLCHLERVTLDHGGRIYLAKDSSLSPDGFAKMYPHLPEFRKVLAEIDPMGKIDSLMSRRLKVRGGES